MKDLTWGSDKFIEYVSNRFNTARPSSVYLADTIIKPLILNDNKRSYVLKQTRS